MMAKEGADNVELADRKVVETKTPLQRELTVETPTGRRTMLSVKFPLIDSTGAVSAVGTIVTDVTDQKRAEDRLAQAQRMEAIGQLTGGVAHDFNNMLTAILLNADVLATQIQNDSLRQLAVAMRHAAEHGADLTRRLLAFGRRQTLEPRPTDINELLRDMEPLMQRTLGEHIEIELRARRRSLAGDRRSGAAGKRGSQSCGQRPRRHARWRAAHHRDRERGARRGVRGRQPRYAGRVLRHGRRSAIPVPAWRPDVLAHAFEPFFTTKDVGKGTGLGLSMVYGFVKQSDGHVRIYSEVGVGTVVRLYLPRSKELATAVPTPAAAPAELPTGTETILLVEDDALVRTYAAAQLRALGYRVVAAENAQRAIEAVEQGCVPDLLFTDMIMPGGMNGRDLAERLRRLRPGLKVLYTSGYAHGAIDGSAGQHAAPSGICSASPIAGGALRARCARFSTSRRRPREPGSIGPNPRTRMHVHEKPPASLRKTGGVGTFGPTRCDVVADVIFARPRRVSTHRQTTGGHGGAEEHAAAPAVPMAVMVVVVVMLPAGEGVAGRGKGDGRERNGRERNGEDLS